MPGIIRFFFSVVLVVLKKVDHKIFVKYEGHGAIQTSL